jgi:RimJ/RimL family protein N-acetyltransferase
MAVPISHADRRSRVAQRPQVRLVPATVPLLNALEKERTLFGALMDSPVPDGWPEFPEAIGFTIAHLQNAPEADHAWSMQFFVDAATGRLLGSGGFAAPPVDRTVEIGYEVAPEFRGRGFGTAAARALVERAVGSGEVDHVIAHTRPGPNASTGVLVSLGFEHVTDQQDPEIGAVWEWRWTRS